MTRENVAHVGFLVDETLFVVQVTAGGLAEQCGVHPGMSLIGFGEHHVETTPKIRNSYLQWTTVRKMAAATAFPHIYTFATVDEEKGAVAVDIFLGLSTPTHTSQPLAAERAAAESARAQQAAAAAAAAAKVSHAALPAAREDAELPSGALVDVRGRGVGVYQSFKRKRFGSNEHWLSFEGGAAEVVNLKQYDDWFVYSVSGALAARMYDPSSIYG